MSRLSLLEVRKSFPGRPPVSALGGVDFEVEAGQFVSVIGPSGCGKSTLLYMIGGLLPLDGGQILYNKRPVTGPGPERGMVFQEFALFPWLSVAKNVAFGLTLGAARPRWSRAAVDARVAELVAIVGLEGFEDRKPDQLSGGMKQRVAIASCLATDPDVLLMDEPFGALDAQTRLAMQRELVRLHERMHKTVVFVTHDIREAVLLSDRVVVLSRRPGVVKEIVRIPIPRPRADRGAEFSAEFTELTKRLSELLD
jgi:NitT/TauT family transport system ATP-binding protein